MDRQDFESSLTLNIALIWQFSDRTLKALKRRPMTWQQSLDVLDDLDRAAEAVERGLYWKRQLEASHA